ncbi:MAG: hypothetical protein KDC53_09015 [Saprospiraceae bacterium]|nr:hypothetical protein [Saprospiraceae bacterium]
MNPIVLLVGRINSFLRVVKEDRHEGLHNLQVLQSIIDQGTLRYQGTQEFNYTGEAFQLSFPNLLLALDCARFIREKCTEVDLIMPLVISSRSHSDPVFQSAEYPPEILVHQGLQPLFTGGLHEEIDDSILLDEDRPYFILQREKKADVANVNRWLPKKRRRTLAMLAGLLVIAMGLISRTLPYNNYTKTVADKSIEKKSIAVIPFNNKIIGRDSLLVDGMMDEIRNHLSRMDGLKVISPISSNRYVSSSKSISQIAQELNVEYILEGSVSEWDDRIRIVVQLVNVVHDEQLWGETYEWELKDIFAIQSEVSQNIARTLRQNISPELSSQIDRAPTNKIEAYNEVMASRELNRIRTKASMEESLKRLDHALEIDPQYVDALAQKAVTISVMGTLGYGADTDLNNSLAERYALQAIKLDPLNSQAYAALGNVYFIMHKWDQAETSFQIAIQNNPNNALAFYWYSLELRYLGEMNKAIEYGSIAAELDPLYPVIQTGHALTCIMADRLDLTEEIIDKGAVIFQNYFGYHWILGYYQMAKEDYEQAIRSFTRSQELSPAINSIQRQIMFCKGKLGHKKEVEEYIRSHDGSDPESLINLASAYMGLGDEDKCIDYLKQFASTGRITPSELYNVKFREVFKDSKHKDFVAQINQISRGVH